MNHELPKSVRDALARHTSGDVHPSADALTAFAERSLPEAEKQHVTDHLARCADCREVIFLTSNAAEVLVENEQELAAAVPVRRTSPGLVTGSEAPSAMARPTPIATSPRRTGWRWRWAWAPAIAAVVIFAGVLFFERPEFETSSRLAVASKMPAPAPAASEGTSAGVPANQQPAAESKPAALKPPTKASGASTRPAGNGATLAANKIERMAPEAVPSAGVAAPPAKPADSASLDALLGPAKAPPTTVQMGNSFAADEGQATTALLARPHPPLEKPQMAMRSVGGRTQWRVNSDGHLEHSTTPGIWTLMLADQGVTFHVVSVLAGNVWAGGSGGALFHSSDSGQRWSKSLLTSSSAGTETATIVSIRFSDAEHGVVTTDGGSRWTTSDGGVTWIKE